MARFTVKYEVVLESSILIDAVDEQAAEEAVERWVQSGQHLAKPIDFGIIGTHQHEDDPEGDW